jgi:hypothetical protein
VENRSRLMKPARSLASQAPKYCYPLYYIDQTSA